MVPFSMTWNDPKPRFQDCTIVAEYLSCMKHRTVYLRQPSFSFYPPADYMQHSLQQRVLALDLEGVHDLKLHHPSSSVATSNQ